MKTPQKPDGCAATELYFSGDEADDTKADKKIGAWMVYNKGMKPAAFFDFKKT